MVHPFVDLKIGLYFLCKHMDSKMHKSFFRRKNTHFHFVSFCTIIWHDYSSFLRDICKKKLGSKILLGKPVFWPPSNWPRRRGGIKMHYTSREKVLKHFRFWNTSCIFRFWVVWKKKWSERKVFHCNQFAFYNPSALFKDVCTKGNALIRCAIKDV